MRITAVMPAHNEVKQILDTIAELCRYVAEVLVIDDASTDETAALAEQVGAKVFRNAANRGYISAIKKAVSGSCRSGIVILDADGELPADKIPELVRPSKEKVPI